MRTCRSGLVVATARNLRGCGALKRAEGRWRASREHGHATFVALACWPITQRSLIPMRWQRLMAVGLTCAGLTAWASSVVASPAFLQTSSLSELSGSLSSLPGLLVMAVAEE